jgi:hypothetical protein
MRFITIAAIALLAAACAKEEGPSKDANKDAVEVEAGKDAKATADGDTKPAADAKAEGAGVKVKAGDNGAEVDANGTKVKADEKGGSVETGNVRVDKKGVKAGGVEVTPNGIKIGQ